MSLKQLSECVWVKTLAIPGVRMKDPPRGTGRD